MQNLCFGIAPTSYAQVSLSDQQITSWTDELPPHFRMVDPDTSLDDTFPFLRSQRLSLHSKFHLARLALHRPFLVRDGDARGIRACD